MGKSRTLDDVAPAIGRFTANWAAALELDLEELVEGLSCTAEQLRGGRTSIPWDDFSWIYERAYERAGRERCWEIAANPHEYGAERQIAILSAFVSPLALYKFVNRVLGPSMYPMVRSETRVAGTTYELKLSLRDGYRDSKEHFELIGATQAGMPQHIGLGPSEMRYDVGPRGGHYWVTPPRSGTLVARVSRATRGLFGSSAMAELEQEKLRLAQAYEELYRAHQRLEPRGEPGAGNERDPAAELSRQMGAAIAAWELTPRQTEVVAALVEGASNKDIAHRLNCAVKTIEGHVTDILRRADVDSRGELVAAFWTDL